MREPSGLRSGQLGAALLVGLEAVALVGLAVVYAVRGALGDAASAAGAEAGAALIGLVGVLLGLVARGLARARGWARTPALVVQLFGLLVGVDLVRAHAFVSGAVLVLLAVAVLAQLAVTFRR